MESGELGKVINMRGIYGKSKLITFNQPIWRTKREVAGGGVFGDHCSPLSDTSILASTGAASDHMDHIKTQIPYAILSAGVSLVIYFVLGWLLFTS